MMIKKTNSPSLLAAAIASAMVLVLPAAANAASISTNNSMQEVVLIVNPLSSTQIKVGIANSSALTNATNPLIAVESVDLSQIPGCGGLNNAVNSPASTIAAITEAGFSSYQKNARDVFQYIYNPNYPVAPTVQSGTWLEGAISANLVPPPENLAQTSRALSSVAWSDNAIVADPALYDTLQRSYFVDKIDSKGAAIQLGASEALEIFTCEELSQGQVSPPYVTAPMSPILRSSYGYVNIISVFNVNNNTAICGASSSGTAVFPLSTPWSKTVSGNNLSDCVAAFTADMPSIRDKKGRAATQIITSASCAVR
jgi:hypothetical protein